MSIISKSRLSKQNIVFSAIASLCLVFASIGDIHSHFCLDGQEPAVTLHFENLDGHPDHEGDQYSHNDFETELPTETLQIKAIEFAIMAVNNTFFDSFVVDRRLSVSGLAHETLNWSQSVTLYPPLRAPPAFL